LAHDHRINVRAVLLDIEGTITPISFVYETLFPYARAHGPQFIRENWVSDAICRARAQLREVNETDRVQGAPYIEVARQDLELQTTIEYYLWLMDRDRKVTPLKAIQGLVWAEGYRRGELKSEIFEDVPRAFSRWREQGLKIAIFSSGSILAQRQLLQNSDRGDLTGFIAAYFDTETGGKRQKESYASIVKALDTAAAGTLFVSDVVAELDAAVEAGMGAALARRPGNAEPTEPYAHRPVRSFDELN
jgi:enolase-phosphatase E1